MQSIVLNSLCVVLVVSIAALAWRGALPFRGDRANLLALIAGTAYGVLARVVFGLHDAHGPKDMSSLADNAFVVMSWSFLFLVPFAIGVLHQLVPNSRVRGARAWLRAFFAPMLPVLLMVAILGVLAFEGLICIAMALPALWLLAGIGGLVGLAIRMHAERKARNLTMAVVLLLPYAAAPAETHWQAPLQLRAVHNSVVVHAPPEVVWREIASVSRIATSELPFRMAHLIGLPRPIEATLSQPGVGGVRTARFERGLRFRERVTGWEPARSLAFAIQAEPAPESALDEHVAVGGDYFDVLDGTYRLETRADGSTLLHLTSHQRLSTHFNFYAAVWSDFIMSDLQSAIMDVIRKRCER